MMRTDHSDIRLFYENDVRFLIQFYGLDCSPKWMKSQIMF
jgi:hypothetical protein